MDIQILAQKFYDYSTYIKGYAKPTLRRYRQVINFFCNFAKVTEIEQVTPDNVRALFYYGRTERHWSANSFIGHHKTLCVFFRWCIQEKYMLPPNPTDDIEIPKLEKHLPVRLNKQQAHRILEVSYNYPYHSRFTRCRNHAIFATFLLAGLRKQELLNLKLADVDLQNLSIFVYQGKGSKDRIVPMSYKLAESLKRYLEERKRLHKTCPEFFCQHPV